MKFLKGLIIKCIGYCRHIETSYDNGYFLIPADNHGLLDVMNMFYRMGITFDYERVTEVVPFVKRQDYFKLFNFRQNGEA